MNPCELPVIDSVSTVFLAVNSGDLEFESIAKSVWHDGSDRQMLGADCVLADDSIEVIDRHRVVWFVAVSRGKQQPLIVGIVDSAADEANNFNKLLSFASVQIRNPVADFPTSSTFSCLSQVFQCSLGGGHHPTPEDGDQ